mmetsp:Transcript_30981/g.29809  ORF Transcript_30981/g.29809 Transcript_30981/m.29809 type:complete len:100 (-) Transcript_30981:85-384(-)|eukprot:CAMPEP_0197824642 /NCGR_PEP_ID=MMETSP1437-20131217/1868_1 /TAXON_ID=49252 ORGANISM="Eucampia antarctica, Strain CCMP1452" /NCGR_SAMPLE_ID=MMETSP1437 /ASSEMBLY_ACC=CAM_ASM_001096 /LENGTH=99 /DNA_ID=CAMNT_0043424349 /DNA_START=112 /DNA_END=411 /DNA_ORIENTATION=+
MTNMEILYSEMSPFDLECMRLNRMMRQKENGGMIAIDECCEVLNDHLKKMTSSVKLDSLVNKSLFVSLTKRCTKNLGFPWHANLQTTGYGIPIMIPKSK